MAEVQPFDPESVTAAYLYVAVADHIAARIVAGELVPGARLPAERDLAAAYHVAIGTVRRATEELRTRGLVVTLPGKGTYIVQKDG